VENLAHDYAHSASIP